MSTTPRPPLLSDEFMENHADKWNEGVRGITIQHRTCLLQGADWAREHYEAARAKDAELIQQLTDTLKRCDELYSHGAARAYEAAQHGLKAAAAAGFKPTEP